MTTSNRAKVKKTVQEIRMSVIRLKMAQFIVSVKIS